MAIVGNNRIAEIGVAVQTNEATVATNPKYVAPLFSGRPQPGQTIDNIEATDVANQPTIVWKTEQHVEGSFTMPAFSYITGPMLLGMYNTDTFSTPNHVFSMPTSGTEKWLTFFTRLGSLYEKFGGCSLSELSFSWSGDGPVTLGGTIVGKSAEFLTSPYTDPTDAFAGTYAASGGEQVLSWGTGPESEWFTPIGATLQFDEDSGTPVTHTNIRGGTITINRQVELLRSADNISPAFVHRGMYSAGVTLDLIWQDWDAYRATFYGGIAGTTFSSSILEGSVNVTFSGQPNIAATPAARQLTINVPKVALLADPPEPDAGGGPITVSISGQAIRGAGDLVTTTLKNNGISTAIT